MKCLPSEGVPHTRVLAYEKCPHTELLTLQRIVNVSEVFSPLIFLPTYGGVHGALCPHRCACSNLLHPASLLF